VASTGGLDRDEMSSRKLLAGLLPRSTTDRVLLAFYRLNTYSSHDHYTSGSPIRLLRSLTNGGRMAGGIPIVGAGLLGDYDFSATRQFCGDRVLLSSMWSGVLHSGLSPSIMPSCTAVFP